ncbi:hypothetical protein [Mycobacterium spongiae]|uniref:Uncharacterized protein n=1 Tax=Mycobacterium spongiae TaxID=886343 RepID=A0A975K0Q3_9MYCO|nr:hypothetical protein [Mycobacterium spongiae]QUR69225.1 hypothetical protein F6B93_21025 [Mycobacterium spongiae]
MTATFLAAPDAVFRTGYLVAALGVPTVGWILLIVGLKQRSRGRPQPGARSTNHPASPPEKSAGTRLILVGAVLMALGVLAIIARLATADPAPSEGSLGREWSKRPHVLASTTCGLATNGEPRAPSPAARVLTGRRLGAD